MRSVIGISEDEPEPMELETPVSDSLIMDSSSGVFEVAESGEKVSSSSCQATL